MLFAEKPELVCSKKLCGMLLESKELNQNNDAIENIEDEINKFKNPHNKHKLENIGEEENKPKKKRSEIIPVTFAPYPSQAVKKENPKKTIYYPKYTPKDESGNKKEIKKKSMPIQNSMIQPSPTMKDEDIDVQLIYRRHSMPIKRDGVKINSKSNNTSPEIKGHTKKTSSQPVSPQQPLSPKLRVSNKQQQKQKPTQQQQQQQQQRQVTQKRKQPDSTYILFISLGLISGLIICFGIANLFSTN